ncbi:MAG: hypothetical protein ACYCWW_01745 [Deltaproteobacteria bacterium]
MTNAQNRALLLILWDECESCGGGTGSGTAQPMLLVTAPQLLSGSHAISTVVSHSSVVKSMQEIFRVTPTETDPTTSKAYPWLRHAGDSGTNDLSSFFASGQFP